ncbi:UNVERIFIED_CONTAM: Myrcene synthase, chloroplastic [Sesamum calycinum]|uniref:Myrcene synthase, chloroplastic n=1 Tax=Sesamum calycinum TaxID=2727403 RepID=A0AAW2PRG0_9LAMI
MAASIITMKMLIIPNNTTTQNLDNFASKKKTLRLRCISSSGPAAATACCSPSFQHAPSRRSGNYGPSLWDFDYIQSLNTQYAVREELSRVEELLELIDDLQRLGMSYHFEDEINQMLGCLYEQKYAWGTNNSAGKEGFALHLLHSDSSDNMALASPRNEKGDFDPNLGNDTKGLLQLYEASFLSTPAPLTLWHTYFVVANPTENEVVGSLHKYKDIVRYSGMILRLADDLGTSPAEMKRGDVAKAVECYMNERGGSREEAEEYVRYLIDETWKKMNEGVAAADDDSPFLQDFVRIAADVGRTAQYFYQHGDGHGIQNPQMKQSIPTLLFQPII